MKTRIQTCLEKAEKNYLYPFFIVQEKNPQNYLEELDAVWLIRRRIAEADTVTATNAVISFMEKTTSNMSFVLSVKKSFAAD